MKNFTGIALGLLMVTITTAVVTGDVFAARLGGGRSFGSRPSYSQSYQRSPTSQPGLNGQGSFAQKPAYSAAQQSNQSIRNSLAQRGGLMGMLGGLALGGLLGAMLFGGAFENINFVDILVFGLMAFMLFKLLAGRRRTMQEVPNGAGYYPHGGSTEADSVSRSGQGSSSRPSFNTDVLFGKGRAVPPKSGSLAMPADFDAKAFLNGAKAAYAQMQKAWDEADLAELRALSTDKVFGELQDQIRARAGADNRTDVLKVEAEILEVRDVGSDREVTVLFDAVLREAQEARPAQVREVWHFIRSRNSRQPTWFLDGIQQLED